MTNPSPQGGETPQRPAVFFVRARELPVDSVVAMRDQYDRLADYTTEIERALTRATQENEELKGANMDLQLERSRLRALLVEAQEVLLFYSLRRTEFEVTSEIDRDEDGAYGINARAFLSRLTAELQGEGCTQ